jgi:hypothetical protein
MNFHAQWHTQEKENPKEKSTPNQAAPGFIKNDFIVL